MGWRAGLSLCLLSHFAFLPIWQREILARYNPSPKMERQGVYDYHFFGNLWLEQPSLYLSSTEVKDLDSQVQLIAKLKDRPSVGGKRPSYKL